MSTKFSILIAMLGMNAAGQAANLHVISWAGNSAEGAAHVGVTELRVGCSGSAERCLASADAASRREKVDAFTLALGAPAADLVTVATDLGTASVKDTRLKAIGLDDFLRTVTRWAKDSGDEGAPERILRGMIEGAHKGNPKLGFAITVYEDQLKAPRLTRLPRDLREKISRVSLYLHYRRNASRLPAFVREAHELFPEAELIGGVYAYDRRDYLPCEQGDKGKRKCTTEEETSLFAKALHEQVALVKSGELGGIEFYPGAFGLEQQWSGWSNGRVCPPARRAECVDTTIALRKSAMDILAPFKAPAQPQPQ